MRLRKIRLAGFKSFVDSTTIDLPGDLIGIVGPNGCGKSNIIDAVRWVMGEVSAKHLRGDTMADVVFTGSSTRKPVGQAAVELVFDNTEGRLGGRFAAYQEISVKRQITRDSQSTYFLNGARCRRRDVMDVFLGTGLGPRSYAIIEQGMISRLIEAKPEELREFLEEAAGISKYKERRRETENRIRHTKENLDRLSDLREELGKQLSHLKRQATQAERYKEYKEQERVLEAELLALRWRDLDKEATAHQETVQQQQNTLDRIQADLRRTEADLERQREDHTALSEAFNQAYREVLDAGAEIARGEESIQGMRERQQQLRDTLNSEQSNLGAAHQHIKEDEARLHELDGTLEAREPELAASQTRATQSRLAFKQTEEAMRAWQAEWEDITARVAEPSRAAHAEEARIQQIEQNRASLERRLTQLSGEIEGIDPAPGEAEIAVLQERIVTADQAGIEFTRRADSQRALITALRDERQTLSDALDTARARHRELLGRLASLQALQEAALRKTEGASQAWLEQRGLSAAKRLAQVVSVDEGWEIAVELVLGFRLEAAASEHFGDDLSALATAGSGPLTLFDTHEQALTTLARTADLSAPTLLDKARLPASFGALLGSVRTADTIEQALLVRASLAGHESIITPNGIWMGPGWIHLPADGDGDSILRRERELDVLGAEQATLEVGIGKRAEAQNACRNNLAQAEDQLEVVQSELASHHRERGRLQAELSASISRVERLRERSASTSAEIAQTQTRVDAEGKILAAARDRLRQSTEDVRRLSGERDAWSRQRDQHRERLEEAQELWQSTRDKVYDLGLKVESMRAQAQLLREGRSRNYQRVELLESRCSDLNEQLSASAAPLQAARERLELDLSSRAALEQAMVHARERMEDAETHLGELDAARQEHTGRVTKEREILEALRLQGQEYIVRRRTQEEQLAARELLPRAVLETLDEDASEPAWQENLDQLDRRITRLGPINLAAIDEHAQQAERKQYLDAQNDDLAEALDTLESAIRKIDRETRSRFKDTYERVNSGLSALFPRLFGGGEAHLELTGEDMLDTGVSVMARPPGKRNVNIHLLSGGEKALTAVALVFSIFELNPAPFCLLDEVDAPLDDVNVVRFCQLVKEMSERLQFLVVTHNKITMEISQQLVGVTMSEPGVSRLVAVDIDAAVELSTA